MPAIYVISIAIKAINRQTGADCPVRRMIKNLLVFVFSLLAWSGLLWFGIRPDFIRQSTPLLISLHLLPPLALSAASWWHQLRERRRAGVEQQQREAEAQRQRETAHRAAQEQHHMETVRRRRGCDCRFVAVTGLSQTGDQDVPELDNVVWDRLAADDPALAHRPLSPLTALRNHLAHALQQLYLHCETAIHFPIYLVPPPGTAAEECIRLVRELALPAEPAVAYLHEAENTTQRLIELFERPDLPGCIVLAFDSPLAGQKPPDPDDDPPPRTAEQALRGDPGQAVVALLLTHPELDAMLASLAHAESSGHDDLMKPYWERSQANTEYPRWAAMEMEQRKVLLDLPVLARLQRAATLQIDDKRPSALGLTKQLRSALEDALINAGQRPQPWIVPAGGAAQPPEPTDTQPVQCAWLVHNAGSHTHRGVRLGALGTALHAFEIDLNPIDQACNIVQGCGDLGSGNALFMAALGIIRSAQQQDAVLCAEFTSPSQASVYFVQTVKGQS